MASRAPLARASRLILALLVPALLMSALACSAPTTETPESPNTETTTPGGAATEQAEAPPSEAELPRLTLAAERTPVTVISTARDESADLMRQDTRSLVQGDVVEIGRVGRASLALTSAEEGEPGEDRAALLTSTLLGGTKATLRDLVGTGNPWQIALRFEAGVSRHRVSDIGQPLELELDVGVAAAEVGPDTADLALCIEPERSHESGVPAYWFAVVEGVASVTGDSVDWNAVELDAGEVVALTATGQLVGATSVGVSAIEEWYAEVAAANGMACPSFDLGPSEEELATARAGKTATAAASLTAAAPTASGAGPTGTLTADRTKLKAGECTTLRWKVTGAWMISLADEPVTETGTREVCPDETTTYRLTWASLGGQAGEASVTIEVVPAPTQPGDDGDEEPDEPTDPEPEATDTPCIPCGKPTRRPTVTNPPPPTAPPPTSVPPTEEPTDEPEPTAEPPTEEPPPTTEPTEPPATEPPATEEP